jgi:hypothetical protein
MNILELITITIGSVLTISFLAMTVWTAILISRRNREIQNSNSQASHYV